MTRAADLDFGFFQAELFISRSDVAMIKTIKGCVSSLTAIAQAIDK